MVTWTGARSTSTARNPNIIYMGGGGGTPWGTSAGGGTGGMINPAALQDKLMADYEQTRLARQQRYEQGMGLFGQVADLYKPGGAFEQAAMQQYETGKRRAMTSGMQNLISSGLAKGSNLGAMERGYEAEVGTPFRTQVAAEGQGRLAQAYQNMAGYMAGFPDIYPTAGTLAHLATGGFGALGNLAAQSAAQTSANYQASGGSLWGQDFLGGGGGSSAGGGGSTGGGQSGRSGISEPTSLTPGKYSAGGGGGSQQSIGGSPIMFGTPMMGTNEQWLTDTAGGTQGLPFVDKGYGFLDNPFAPQANVAETIVPSGAESSSLPQTRSGPYKGPYIGSGASRYVWTGKYYRLSPEKS